MIEGVEIIDLPIFSDGRGRVMHFIRDIPEVKEVYFSMVYPGAIKGWHIHDSMTLRYAVPIGNIKLVLFDARHKSPTQFELMEIYIGEMNYKLVKIPPKIWNGFMAVDGKPALVTNAADMVHSPSEIHRMSLHEFSETVYLYDWDISRFG